MLLNNKFLGSDNELKHAKYAIEWAIRKKLPHAVGYGALMYADPENPLYDQESAKKLRELSKELKFPPSEEFALPPIHTWR